VQKTASDGVFQDYKAILPEVKLQPVVTRVRAATPRAPWTFGAALDWRPTPIPMAPDDADLARAEIWKIELPPVPPNAAVSDAFLEIRYQGDVARLYRERHLIDDNFWNGVVWTIGLREADPDWHGAKTDLELRILPLPRTFPMYIEQADKLRFSALGVADSLADVQVVLQYQLNLQAPLRK
jgi:hypothetical protein